MPDLYFALAALIAAGFPAVLFILSRGHARDVTRGSFTVIVVMSVGLGLSWPVLAVFLVLMALSALVNVPLLLILRHVTRSAAAKG